MPDISGFRLEQAIRILKEKGFDKFTIHTTAPPRKRDAGYDGNSRVIRQRLSDDGNICLLVCNEMRAL